MSVAKHLCVGLIQAELRWRDPAGNREHLTDLIDQAGPADLYVLPETFATGFLGDKDSVPEGMDGASVSWMREQAAARSAALAGSLALIDEQGKRRNRFLLVDADGVVACYDKRHLFAFGGEDERYSPGSVPCVAQWSGWAIDLQICYDLRFPVWCRNNRGFDLQIFVANWPSPRVNAWRALLRARAIENQSYVIGVNRTGRDGNGIDHPGCSSAWDPLGEALVELGGDEGSALVKLDLDALHSLRERFPFQADADRFSIG